MSVSAFWLKWVLRFYPPLFFQRIWVMDISADFKTCKVKINYSVLNGNYNRSIFGGTLFAATDPFLPVMFHQVFSGRGYKVIAWSKSAQILFLKPANTNMHFEIKLLDAAINDAEHILNTDGKFTGLFDIDIFNRQGEICVTITSEVYIRDLNFIEDLNLQK